MNVIFNLFFKFHLKIKSNDLRLQHLQLKFYQKNISIVSQIKMHKNKQQPQFNATMLEKYSYIVVIIIINRFYYYRL